MDKADHWVTLPLEEWESLTKRIKELEEELRELRGELLDLKAEDKE